MTLPELKHELTHWKLTRQRAIHLGIGLSVLLFHELIAKPYYRTYIYSNNIFDFHIADTLGNSLGTLAVIFVILGLLGGDRARNLFLVKTSTISMVVYELSQILLGKQTDWWDVLASVLTGGVCILLYKVMYPRVNA